MKMNKHPMFIVDIGAFAGGFKGLSEMVQHPILAQVCRPGLCGGVLVPLISAEALIIIYQSALSSLNNFWRCCINS